MNNKCRFAPLLLLLSTTACAGLAQRHDLATTLAAPAGLTEQQSPAGDFLLTRFGRVTQAGAPVNVYIEGDGLAWLSRSEPSLDPTPTDPVALRLAGLDPAANVIYLARPCQYTGRANGNACDQAYWTGKRFAPGVIAAMDAELTQVKAQYRLTGFNLVGFSGGGAVAALLAERRGDVLSLRTVAGNIDPALFSELHHVSPLAGSLDPLALAARTAAIPQQHFVGGDDTVVPIALAESFRRAVGPSHCVRVTMVPGMAHDAGWAGRWQELLKAPLDCQANQ